MQEGDQMPPTMLILGPPTAALRVFQQAGWGVRVESRFIQAEAMLRAWRGSDLEPPCDVVVVFAAHQDAGALASWMFAADLRLAMASGMLHPTPLVVLDDGSIDTTLRRRYELAGCMILPAPAAPHDLPRWVGIVATHAAAHQVMSLDEQFLHETHARDALLFQQAASAAYAALTGRHHATAWTADEVRALLGALRLSSPRRTRDQDLLARLGGYANAKATVRRCAIALPEPSATAIVLGMLDGKTQEHIAADVYHTREWVCRHLPLLCAMLADLLTHQPAGTPRSDHVLVAARCIELELQ
jgi:hypothetical protein